jgi:hypothetical protein
MTIAGLDRRFLAQPLIGPILRHGLLFRLLLAGCIVSAVTGAMGVPLVECPVPRLTGGICPGCGLTRGVLALLQGRPVLAMHYHAFSPLAVLVGLLFAVMAFTPDRQRLAAAAGIERFERRTGLSAVLLIVLHVYWIVRLIYSPHL